MKKNVLFLVVFTFLCTNFIFGQISVNEKPFSFDNSKSVAATVLVEKMVAFDVEKLKAEDLINDLSKDIPWRFGENLFVNINLNNSGLTEILADGSKLWRVEIESANAVSINLTFSTYRLPEGAKLWVYNSDHTQILGAFTNANNQTDGFFATSLLFDSKITIEYYEPAKVEFPGELHLYRVTHGYRSGFEYAKGLNSSGACEVNVNCPDGIGWEDQKRSVCMLVTGGSGFCTGALINNTGNDGTPYVLTANHCSTENDFATWVFWFNWEAPTCVNPTTSPAHNDVSGSVLKARNAGSDFCLVQMNSTPPLNYNVFYSGWSYATAAAPSATCIHHPKGDIKKISHSGALTTSSMSGAVTWKTSWTSAVTEQGSSGSPLFDDNHRIVGQLFGGNSACGEIPANMNDHYGKFDVSWSTGVTPATRLKDWLDPTNVNPTTLDGYDPNAIVVDLDVNLQSITQPTGNYSALGNIVPTIKVKNNGLIALTSFTAKYKIDADAWVNYTYSGTPLASGASVDVTFPEIALTLGSHTITANVDSPNGGTDLNLTNNDKTANYFVADCGTPINTLPYTEDFSEQALPSCWENVGTNTQVWEFNNPNAVTFNSTTNANGFAILDSDNYGSGTSQNSNLITSTFDLSNYTAINVKFQYYFKYYSTSSAAFYYSIDNGTTWVSVQSWTGTTSATNPAIFNQTIAALAGESQVKFKWNYTGAFAYYMCVDDIEITGTVTAPSFAIAPSLQNVNSLAGSTNFAVYSNVAWSATSNQAWCTLPVTSGNGDATFVANYAMNTGVARTAIITFSTSSLPDIQATVSQAAFSATLQVTPSSANATVSAGTKDFEVISNVDWTVVSNQSWCTLTNASGTGNATVTANYELNTEYARTATLTFSGTNVSDVNVTINQDAFLAINDATKSELNIYPNPSNGIFTIESNLVNVDFNITDVTGRIVFSGKLNNVTKVDLSALAKGTYILKIESSNKIENSIIVIK